MIFKPEYRKFNFLYIPTYFEENEILAIMEIFVVFPELDKKGLSMRTILLRGGHPSIDHTLKASIVKGGPNLKSINLYSKGGPTP